MRSILQDAHNDNDSLQRGIAILRSECDDTLRGDALGYGIILPVASEFTADLGRTRRVCMDVGRKRMGRWMRSASGNGRDICVWTRLGCAGDAKVSHSL